MALTVTRAEFGIQGNYTDVTPIILLNILPNIITQTIVKKTSIKDLGDPIPKVVKELLIYLTTGNGSEIILHFPEDSKRIIPIVINYPIAFI